MHTYVSLSPEMWHCSNTCYCDPVKSCTHTLLQKWVYHQRQIFTHIQNLMTCLDHLKAEPCLFVTSLRQPILVFFPNNLSALCIRTWDMLNRMWTLTCPGLCSQYIPDSSEVEVHNRHLNACWCWYHCKQNVTQTLLYTYIWKPNKAVALQTPCQQN